MKFPLAAKIGLTTVPGGIMTAFPGLANEMPPLIGN